jgi:hypothetical protein
MDSMTFRIVSGVVFAVLLIALFLRRRARAK